MSLLTPFKNIWNDVATPVDNAVRGVGDLGSLIAAKATGNQQAASNAGAALTNAVHNVNQEAVQPVVHTAESFVQPVISGVQDYSQAFGNLGNAAAGAPQESTSQFFTDPVNRAAAKFAGTTGRGRQLAGDAAQVALDAASGGADAAVNKLAIRAVPEVASRLIAKPVAGAALGSAYNTASYLGGDQPITVKGLGTAASNGAEAGALFGGVAAVPDIINAGKVAAANLTPLDESGHIGSPGDSSTPKPQGAAQNLDADRAAQSILENTGDPEQAAAVHQSITGDTTGNTQDAIQRIAHQSNLANIGNPLTGLTDLPKIAEGDTKGAILNSQKVVQDIADRKDQVNKAVGKLDDHDKGLLDGLRFTSPEDLAKQAHSPSEVLDAANKIKDANDYAHATGNSLGQSVPYRQNYGAPLTFADTGPESVEAADNYRTRLATDPGYAQGRKYASYEDAANASNGLLQPKNGSFLEDFNEGIDRRSRDLQQLAVAKGLQEAHPGQIRVGDIGADESGVYKQLKIPGGQKLSASADLADTINHRAIGDAPQGLEGGAAKVYDNVNGFYKALKLSVGLFHDLNTYGAYLGKQLFSRDALDGKQLAPLAAKISPKYFENLKQAWRDSGALDKMHISSLTGISDSLGSEGGKVTLTSGRYNPLGILHDSLFKREIPTMKGVIFDQETRDMDINSPTDRAQMQVIARRLNEGFGGANRAIDGMTPRQAKVVGRFVLAPDYEEGQIKTVLAALTKGGADGRLARQLVGGRAALFAVPGVIAAGLAGNLTSPGAWTKFIANQLINPNVPTGFTNDKGEKQIANLPSNPVTKGVRIVEPFFGGDKTDKFSGLEHEATGNLASLPSELSQLKNNQDYYGNSIINRDSNGKVRVGQTLEQLAASQGPIPTTHFENVAKGKESLGAAVTNVVGARTSTDPNDPKYQAAQEYYNALDKYTDGLNANEKAAYATIHPANKDSSGNYQVQPSVFDTPQKAETYLRFPNVLAADDKLNQELASKGQKVDPFFQLPAAQQKAYLAYQTINKDNTGALSVWQTQNNSWAKPFEQARSLFYNSLPAGDPNKPKNPIQPPDETPDVNQAYTKYNALTDPTQRSQFLAANPGLGAYMDQYAGYTNRVLKAQGLPQLKPYPTTDAATTSYAATYLAASKDARAGLKASNPDGYAAMQKYLAQTTEWELDRQAAVDQLQPAGATPSQSYLKDVYNLGNYDVADTKQADGTSVYSLDPTAAAQSYSNYTGSSGSSSSIKDGGAISNSAYTKAGNTNKYGYNSTTSPTALNKGTSRLFKSEKAIKTGHVRVRSPRSSSLRIRSSHIKVT